MRSFNGNIVFLFRNNAPSYEPVLITQTDPGNGSALVVLLYVGLSTETSSQLNENFSTALCWSTSLPMSMSLYVWVYMYVCMYVCMRGVCMHVFVCMQASVDII